MQDFADAQVCKMPLDHLLSLLCSEEGDASYRLNSKQEAGEREESQGKAVSLQRNNCTILLEGRETGKREEHHLSQTPLKKSHLPNKMQKNNCSLLCNSLNGAVGCKPKPSFNYRHVTSCFMELRLCSQSASGCA